MQPEWEAALQKQRDRVIVEDWHYDGEDEVPYTDVDERALDDLIRLARAIGAAEACDAERRDPVWCTHNEDVSAIIRELGVE